MPPNVNHHKANIHCYSTVSDGKFTPLQLKKMYLANGYSILACTDHQNSVSHNELTERILKGLRGALDAGMDAVWVDIYQSTGLFDKDERVTRVMSLSEYFK